MINPWRAMLGLMIVGGMALIIIRVMSVSQDEVEALEALEPAFGEEVGIIERSEPVLEDEVEAVESLEPVLQDEASSAAEDQLAETSINLNVLEWERERRLRTEARSYLRKWDMAAVFYLKDSEEDPGLAMIGLDKRPLVRARQSIERFRSFQGLEGVPDSALKAVRQTVLNDAILAYTARAEIGLSRKITTEVETRISSLRKMIGDKKRSREWVKNHYGSIDTLRDNVTDTVLTERYLANNGRSRADLLVELYTRLEVLWKNDAGE
ncbi:hypothetical protein N8198_02720 [Gammaproteobacteria bacterium]|nr:hypothetical protein [Gammaproteobacteria bacterium]